MPRATTAQSFEVLVPVASGAQPLIPPVPADPATPQPPRAPSTPSVQVADSPPPPIEPQPAVNRLPPVPPQNLPQQARLPDSLTEKKLKVLLHLGDERPRFEVRDGDELYLRVVCDRVEVKAPSDRGEPMSVLKASGQVMFVTPGGEGTCGELSLVPGTGQVLVNGQVAFRYSWGRVETTVSGDRMTFRLGSAPGMAPATLPASFQERR
jgi:hypothetical protein